MKLHPLGTGYKSRGTHSPSTVFFGQPNESIDTDFEVVLCSPAVAWHAERDAWHDLAREWRRHSTIFCCWIRTSFAIVYVQNGGSLICESSGV